MNNRYLDELGKVDLWDRAATLFSRIWKPTVELYDGITKGTVPWPKCLTLCLFLEVAVLFKRDLWLLTLAHVPWLYPRSFCLHYLYYAFVVSSPFWTWALHESTKKERLSKILAEVFEGSGLKNNLGKLPNFVFDRPIDSTTRKLRLTRAVLSMSAFQKAKEGLEGGLHIYIDEIRENRTSGTVDVIYSDKPMPELCKIANYAKVPRGTFVVGTTRSREIRANLNTVPHFLVAGQTGGGKSTFLRQSITTLFLNDDTSRFTLIDLKGGIEFQLFENLLPRVQVPQNLEKAIYFLDQIPKMLDYRMKLLKANRCKDILEYYKKDKNHRVEIKPDSEEVSRSLHRHIIVVDEAAEMFLAGDHAGAKEVQKARRILSQVARQGRSIGVHLVVATQRPDSRALDPQIKANLTPLCFQMANDASSILVLGNGRATDLPAVPGRAIWKYGMEMHEVQTPYLEPRETEELLDGFYQAEADPGPEKKDSAPESKAEENRHDTIEA